MDMHDELTDTGIIRIQRADAQAREDFVADIVRRTTATPTVTGDRLPAPIGRAKPAWLVKAEAEAARRFAAVQWQDGKWYGLYEEDAVGGAAAQLFYRCEIDGDEIFLVQDQDDCDKHFDPEVHSARDIISSGTVVVPL